MIENDLNPERVADACCVLFKAVSQQCSAEFIINTFIPNFRTTYQLIQKTSLQELVLYAKHEDLHKIFLSLSCEMPIGAFRVTKSGQLVFNYCDKQKLMELVGTLGQCCSYIVTTFREKGGYLINFAKNELVCQFLFSDITYSDQQVPAVPVLRGCEVTLLSFSRHNPLLQKPTP